MQERRDGRSCGHPRRTARLVGRSGGIPARRPGHSPDSPGTRSGVPAHARIAAMSGPDRGSTAVLERPRRALARNGGVPARRAVVRWAWRLLRHEWRQQLLILALITVAVG